MRNRLNIVMILAEDMGFTDLSCTECKIRTPNLEVEHVWGFDYAE